MNLNQSLPLVFVLESVCHIASKQFTLSEPVNDLFIRSLHHVDHEAEFCTLHRFGGEA